MYSITTKDKMWTDPIVDSKLATFKLPSSPYHNSNKQKQPEKPCFSWHVIDLHSKKQRDFITEIIKGFHQHYDTEKDYVVSFDRI